MMKLSLDLCCWQQAWMRWMKLPQAWWFQSRVVFAKLQPCLNWGEDCWPWRLHLQSRSEGPSCSEFPLPGNILLSGFYQTTTDPAAAAPFYQLCCNKLLKTDLWCLPLSYELSSCWMRTMNTGQPVVHWAHAVEIGSFYHDDIVASSICLIFHKRLGLRFTNRAQVQAERKVQYMSSSPQSSWPLQCLGCKSCWHHCNDCSANHENIMQIFASKLPLGCQLPDLQLPHRAVLCMAWHSMRMDLEFHHWLGSSWPTHKLMGYGQTAVQMFGLFLHLHLDGVQKMPWKLPTKHLQQRVVCQRFLYSTTKLFVPYFHTSWNSESRAAVAVRLNHLQHVLQQWSNHDPTALIDQGYSFWIWPQVPKWPDPLLSILQKPCFHKHTHTYRSTLLCQAAVKRHHGGIWCTSTVHHFMAWANAMATAQCKIKCGLKWNNNELAWKNTCEHVHTSSATQMAPCVNLMHGRKSNNDIHYDWLDKNTCEHVHTSSATQMAACVNLMHGRKSNNDIHYDWLDKNTCEHVHTSSATQMAACVLIWCESDLLLLNPETQQSCETWFNMACNLTTTAPVPHLRIIYFLNKRWTKIRLTSDQTCSFLDNLVTGCTSLGESWCGWHVLTQRAANLVCIWAIVKLAAALWQHALMSWV